MKNRTLHRLFAESRLMRRLSMRVLGSIELAALRGHKDPEALALIGRIQKERESLLSSNEAFLLYSVVRAQSAVPGAMAEVGVYQGCSAKLISSIAHGQQLHLFDTFDGLPPPTDAESGHLRKAQYRASLDSVRRYLSGHDNVVFHPGLFPATAQALVRERFSFVHLDVDLKQSTRDCLDFFYPRMMPGGIILTHDYSLLDGVRQAFSEFLEHRPVPPGRSTLIELPTSQAMLVC